jgi:hypothetical protein
LENIPNEQNVEQKFQIQVPPKYNPIGIFGLKRNHLATLVDGRKEENKNGFLSQALTSVTRLG